jgi:hypothetical protein
LFLNATLNAGKNGIKTFLRTSNREALGTFLKKKPQTVKINKKKG